VPDIEQTKATDEQNAPSSVSVSANILGQFFDTLEQDQDLAAVAPSLRKLVLDDGVFAEPSIKATLFADVK
jgi:hypothetical protein